MSIDYSMLISTALTFVLIVGVFLIIDSFSKRKKFKGKGFKFWAALFVIYMAVAYILHLLRNLA